MESVPAEFLIFTHCDVYFPKRWFARLEWEVDRLAHIDPNWAVAGISGKTSSDELVGRMWDASLEPITKGRRCASFMGFDHPNLHWPSYGFLPYVEVINLLDRFHVGL